MTLITNDIFSLNALENVSEIRLPRKEFLIKRKKNEFLNQMKKILVMIEPVKIKELLEKNFSSIKQDAITLRIERFLNLTEKKLSKKEKSCYKDARETAEKIQNIIKGIVTEKEILKKGGNAAQELLRIKYDEYGETVTKPLPEEILYQIFSHGDYTDVCIVQIICRRWNRISLEVAKKPFMELKKAMTESMIPGGMHADLEGQISGLCDYLHSLPSCKQVELINKIIFLMIDRKMKDGIQSVLKPLMDYDHCPLPVKLQIIRLIQEGEPLHYLKPVLAARDSNLKAKGVIWNEEKHFDVVKGESLPKLPGFCHKDNHFEHNELVLVYEEGTNEYTIYLAAGLEDNGYQYLNQKSVPKSLSITGFTAYPTDRIAKLPCEFSKEWKEWYNSINSNA